MIRRPPRSTRTDTSFPTRRSSDLRYPVPSSRCGPKKPTSRSRKCPMRSTRERSEEHTSELQSLMRISYAVFCLKKKNKKKRHHKQKERKRTTKKIRTKQENNIIKSQVKIR